MTSMQEFMEPVIAGTAVGSYMLHSPKEMKDKMTDEFYEKLNEAKLEYARCKKLAEKDKPFSDDAIFSKLGKIVAGLMGHENDPVSIDTVIRAALDEYAKMSLDKLVEEASKTL
jgi:hypothetical protein